MLGVVRSLCRFFRASRAMAAKSVVIRVYYGLYLDGLPTNEWAKLFQLWIFVNRTKLKADEVVLENTIRKVLYELAKAIYGNKK